MIGRRAALRGLLVGLVAWLPPEGAAAAAPLDGDGIVEMVFDPWSSRLAATEAAKFDRLAGVLSQMPGSRLQVLVGDSRDAAMHRFLERGCGRIGRWGSSGW